MKVIKPDNLSLIFTPAMIGKQLYLSVGSMAYFSLDLKLPERLMEEAKMWKAVTEALEKDEVFDIGYPKQRGEYLVYGSCFPGGSERAALVQVEVAGLKKRLQVSGNRKWNVAGFPGEPQPFTEMKINYHHAFGGPGYEMNPLGKGAVPDDADLSELPNIQDPHRLIASDSDRPAPEGFTAYPMTWPQRAKHLGRFDERWLSERWPYYPLDTEGEYFNTAPEDQRLEGFFRGDEKIRIVNMHPEKKEIVSALPTLRPRIFINQSVKDGEEFREVKMRPETVWLFPDRESGVILFRGVTPTGDEELEDCLHLMAQWESLAVPPHPCEHYHRLFLETVNPVESEIIPPADAKHDMPAGITFAPTAPSPPSAPSPAADALSKDIASLEAKADARLQELGITTEDLMKKYLPGQKPEAPVSPEEFKKMISELEGKSEARMKELGTDKVELIKKYLPETSPASPVNQKDFLKEVVSLETKSNASLGELGVTREELIKRYLPDAEPGSPTQIADLANLLAGQKDPLASAVVMPAAIPSPPEPPTVVRELTMEEVMKRYQRGESLAHLDLGSLDFTGKDLAGADFSDTILEKTLFGKAKLQGADFSRAVMIEADFSEANLSEAKLCGVTGTSAKFSTSILTRSDLSEGDFTAADFTEADLSKAILNGGIFEKAVMRKVKGKGMSAAKTDFCYADLTEAHFAAGDFWEADFSYAALSGINLTDAKADGLKLHGATGENAVFHAASLQKSRGDKDTVLTGADLSLADLTRSCWEGANLPGVRMELTILDQADFSRSLFSDAHLINASARETKFIKALFTDADMRGMNLFKGSLRKAKIAGTDLKNSNLYGVDFYGAKITKTDLRGANIKMTLLAVGDV
ncbi:MAG: DUF2169 domain-containing protein [Syntrophus sp. (in: bacteria)]